MDTGTDCWTFPHGRDGALPTAPPMGDSSPGSRLQQRHLGPRDPSSGLMVKNGLCQPVQAPTNYPPTLEHPGCIPPTALWSLTQLCAVPMDHSIVKVKPWLRNPQICNTPSPYGSTIPDQLWDLLAVAWGIPMSWVIPRQRKPTQASLSPLSSSEDPRALLQPAGTRPYCGHDSHFCWEVFLHTLLLPLLPGLLIGPGQLHSKTMGLKSYRSFRELCTVPRVFFDRK